MFGALGEIETTGKKIVEAFDKMINLLTEIRDDTKAVRVILEKREEKQV